MYNSGYPTTQNTVSALHKELGRTCSRIVRFMRRRAEAIAPGSHILLDGTLKSDESRVNSLSDFSRKARTKGTRDISVLYALLIATHGMLDFDGVLADREGISFRKARVSGGRKWLYSFRDASQAHAEDAAYLAKGNGCPFG